MFQLFRGVVTQIPAVRAYIYNTLASDREATAVINHSHDYAMDG